MDTSSKAMKDTPPANETYEDAEDLELRGLLSGVQTARGELDRDRDVKSKRGLLKWLGVHGSKEDEKPWSRRRITACAVVLILILLGAALAPPLTNLGGRKGTGAQQHPNSKFVGSELRSNGTHDFKRTVLIVSIDGLRYPLKHAVLWCPD